MAYYTDYYLKISEGGPSIEEIADDLAEITGTAEWYPVLVGDDPATWYSHDKEMREVSVRYPGAVFSLYGLGESRGDEWVAYHVDGKMQTEPRAEWVPPPFDPQKLA